MPSTHAHKTRILAAAWMSDELELIIIMIIIIIIIIIIIMIIMMIIIIIIIIIVIVIIIIKTRTLAAAWMSDEVELIVSVSPICGRD